MKRFSQSSLIVIIGIVLLVLAPAACVTATSPGEACGFFGIWSSDTQLCYVKDFSTTCAPLYDMYAFTGTNFQDVSDWDMVGCGYPPGEEPEETPEVTPEVTPEATPEATPISYVIIDPERGSEHLGQGVDFGYEAQTCDGRCRIALSALTGAAKRALTSAPGKVVGKSYVQIFDQSGSLDYGNFTLCLSARGADAPAFYRLGGGNGWVYMGGYWKGNQFCMRGTMSGNYILVD